MRLSNGCSRKPREVQNNRYNGGVNTEKKPGFVARMKAAVKGFAANAAKFFRDTKSELKKVVWPSKADIKTNTVVVLVTVAIAAVVMIALDAIFGGILGLIIGA